MTTNSDHFVRPYFSFPKRPPQARERTALHDLGRNRRALSAHAGTSAAQLPRFNVCPIATIDAIVSTDGMRTLERMRWGLVPGWWRARRTRSSTRDYNE
jgi:putative SOS response-associated peptidase YedK